MIGGAVLIVGLLLVLAALFTARNPGSASFAGPGPGLTAGRATSAFLLSPIHPATWSANAAIAVGLPVGVFGFAVLATLVSAGLATLLAGVGVVLVALAIEGSRLVARGERRRVTWGSAEPLAAHAYRPFRGGPVDLLRAEFADESRWRDVLYVAVNFPLTVIEFVVVAAAWAAALGLLALPFAPGATPPDWLGPLAGTNLSAAVGRTLLGLALLPVAASLSQLVMALHRGLVSALLCTSESRELRRQVETLRESRSAVLDVEATELRRIERDLHDGAQQRLVALTMDLGLASERIDADPEAARQLVLEGQEKARQALADIRDLVRGIAPSILTDRGLVAALGSLAGLNAVPTSVHSDLPPGERLPAAVERAAYFVVAEALANVAKHSRATRCEVRCRRAAGRLVVEVWDDGAGGASSRPGGGLAGLASRVAGVDGSLSVSSPAGGPTLVHAELPIVAPTGGPDAGWGSTGDPAQGPV